jgi:ribosome recycling factor
MRELSFQEKKMIEEIKDDAKSRMAKSLGSLDDAFKRVRTGRAHPSLLDSVTISYYGSDTPLSQVANVSVEDGRTLVVSPWEKNLIPDVEKAILKSDLGLNPSTSGDVIRLPMPALTEETRKDLIKAVRGEAENSRVAIRNIRRDANGDLKELLKEKEISEDEESRGLDDIQKITDKFISDIEARLKKKEEDLMKV